MHEIDPTIVTSYVAKTTALAAQYPLLAEELEGITTVLNTALTEGVPPVGHPVVYQCGRLEVSRVTFDERPFVVVEWLDELQGSPDIEELVKALERDGVSSRHPQISPGSLILISLSGK